MTERKQVTEYATVVRGTWCTEDIGEVIHKLKHLRSQGYSKVEIEEELDRWSPDSTPILRAIKHRKENDQELKRRIEKEQELRESRRAEYERLKKEFDPNL